MPRAAIGVAVTEFGVDLMFAKNEVRQQ